MNSKYLKTLNKNSIFDITINSGEFKGLYKAQLSSMKHGFYINIFSPFNNNFNSSSLKKVVFNCRTGCPVCGGLYFEFKTTVKEIVNDIIKLKWPENIKKVNRRAHVRVPFDSEIIFFTKSELEIFGRDVKAKKGSILNISAGGLLVESKKAIPINEIVYSKFDFKNKKNRVDSLVVRKIKKDNKNLYGLEFKNISKDLSEEILKFSLEKQRKELQRIKYQIQL